MRRTLLRTTAVLGAAVTAVAAAGLAASAATAATGATAPNGKTAIPNSQPRWLGHAQEENAPASAAAQAVRVRLAPRGGTAALASAVQAVSTPGSKSYQHFLTPAQFFAAWSPTAKSEQSVEAWLAGSGLKITGKDTHNRWVTATGTRQQLDQAFGVTIRAYHHDGQEVTAPDGPTYVPSNLASSVIGVSGLDTTATTAAPPPAAFRNAKPCSLTYGQIAAKYQADYKTPLPKFQGKTLPYAACGYTGPQFRSGYEGSAGDTLDGTGATVGIIDAYASPTLVNDVNTYATNHGDGAYVPGQLTQTNASPYLHASSCDPSGWYGEETLDVEAVHAMAPGANIHYYGAKSCFDDDLLTAQQKVVDDGAVQIVSNSYAEYEQFETADNVAGTEQVLQQGALEGISFTFSSGDNGDEVANTGLKQVDYPASDPYATAVGGTSTGIDANGAIVLDTGWGTNKYSLSKDGTSWTPVGFLYGAGGGYSTLNNRPSYQDGVVSANAPGGRALPDVAMDADPNTGMLIGITQTNPDKSTSYGEYRIGGTSLASPLFAGLTALKIQKAGHGLGFLNPTVYGSTAQFKDIAGTPADAGNVRADYANGVDPSGGVLYSVRTFNQDSSLTVTKGWDDVTGVGVPTPDWVTGGTTSALR